MNKHWASLNLKLWKEKKLRAVNYQTNQTGCHFAVRLWSVLDFMSLFLRRKMEQFSLPQSVPYEQPPNIFKLKSSCTLTHIQRESGTVTRKRKKEKAVRMWAQRPALSPSPASGLILILILILIVILILIYDVFMIYWYWWYARRDPRCRLHLQVAWYWYWYWYMIYMSQLLLLGKFEYGGRPIFKVVLEC